MKTGEYREYLQGLGVPDDALVEQVVQMHGEASQASGG